MTEKTVRPIRVHAGLDVYDLPPDTPARRPGKHAQDQPLELFTGEESVEVEIAGRRRRVAVESDALAADRWWREANSLRDGVRGMSRDLLAIVREGQAQTPRERDPAVWAAAYGAAYGSHAEDAYRACGDGPERVAFAVDSVDAARCRAFADAAVMALHGEAPAEPTPRTKEPGWRSP